MNYNTVCDNNTLSNSQTWDDIIDFDIRFLFETEKRLSVKFAADTKEHDGQRQDTYVFEKLVAHYLKIGGMKCSSQMVEFLNSNNISLEDTIQINNLKKRITDLLQRLKQCGYCKTIPILPEGGGNCYKIGLIALSNIWHLTRVFESVIGENTVV
jgi:hypothetical protein